MPKRLLLILTVCYTLVLAVVSLITISSLPEIGTDYDDKIFHIVSYAILFSLWYFTLKGLKIIKPIFIAVLFSVVYGIIIEVLQGQLTIARHFDIFDVIANCIGVMIGSFFIILRNRAIVKNL